MAVKGTVKLFLAYDMFNITNGFISITHRLSIIFCDGLWVEHICKKVC